LIRHVRPVYPREAKTAHIEGTVRFTATIGKDGRILNLQVISGHPLLVESARAAVSQWEYKPTLFDAQPIEIRTTIDVNFNLSQ
jgi:protein TonB